MVIVSSMLPFSLKNGPSFSFDFNERSSLLFFSALSSSFFLLSSSSPLLYDLALQHALECVDVLCRRQAPSLSCCCPKMAEHRSFFFLFPFFFSCVSLGCVVVLSGTSRISHFFVGRFPIFSGPEGHSLDCSSRRSRQRKLLEQGFQHGQSVVSNLKIFFNAVQTTTITKTMTIFFFVCVRPTTARQSVWREWGSARFMHESFGKRTALLVVVCIFVMLSRCFFSLF